MRILAIQAIPRHRSVSRARRLPWEFSMREEFPTVSLIGRMQQWPRGQGHWIDALLSHRNRQARPIERPGMAGDPLRMRPSEHIRYRKSRTPVRAKTRKATQPG